MREAQPGAMRGGGRWIQLLSRAMEVGGVARGLEVWFCGSFVERWRHAARR